ncbi:MAG: hypoxanthine phosphoribosyltransferase [Gammaproteobacteria bacterium]|nr:hypoxanthine phosphoribosyltransferase [Gammaproteobacteria bacterium]
MNKIYITADQLLEDSFALALDILESGYQPTFLIAVWRGGTPIGIAIQEMLAYHGVDSNHIAVRTSSYSGIGAREKQVRVHSLGYAVDTLRASDRLLIVDDVHDSGLSVEELVRQLQQQCGENCPADIRLATAYYKPKQSKVARVPDYYIHTSNQWLVFPHELVGLSETEIASAKPGLRDVLARMKKYARTER